MTLAALLLLAQVVGPTEAAPGALVVLAAPPAEQTAWVVAAPGEVHWLPIERDARLVLTSPAPQVVRVTAFTARIDAAGKLLVDKHDHEVAIGRAPTPGPPPTPTPTPTPEPQATLSARVRDAWRAAGLPRSRPGLARRLAANYRDVAGETSRALALPASHPLKTVAGVLAETTRRNRAVAPDDPDGSLRRWFVDLAGMLTALNLTESGQLVPVWGEIAAGLESAE